MDAKKELIDQLKTMAGCCENELKVLLDGYWITREPVRERSNLKKQIALSSVDVTLTLRPSV